MGPVLLFLAEARSLRESSPTIKHATLAKLLSYMRDQVIVDGLDSPTLSAVATDRSTLQAPVINSVDS